MKPRILFVDHVSRILGGAEVNLVELLGTPDSRPPWEVTVACDPEGPLGRALNAIGIDTLPFAFGTAVGQLRIVGRRFPLAGALRALRALRTARQDLRRTLERVRPHAVISCTNKDHFAAWPACRAAGIPSVWWVNDIVSADFFPWLARRAFIHQARRGAHRLVAVSDFAAGVLRAEGAPPARTVTIHNGIPIARYRSEGRGALRQRLGLATTEPVVGILGRFTPWKGQDLFIRVATEWIRSHPAGHFVLIGHAFNEDQPYEERLRALVNGSSMGARVHFVPFQKDVAAVLADLDVLVHASTKPEPFGRVIIEAMAAGTPVIAARAGGVPEIITDGENGLLATPGHAGEYLEHLQALLGDPGLRERLRRAAGSTVEHRFSLNRVRQDFNALLARSS